MNKTTLSLELFMQRRGGPDDDANRPLLLPGVAVVLIEASEALLKELGPIARHIEVVKMVPWVGGDGVARCNIEMVIEPLAGMPKTKISVDNFLIGFVGISAQTNNGRVLEKLKTDIVRLMRAQTIEVLERNYKIAKSQADQLEAGLEYFNN